MSLSQLCPISSDYPGFTYFTQVWLCAVRQGVRHLFGPRLPLTNKVRYIISGSRWGERGKMCPFKGTEGKKHLRSSGKGPQKRETGGAEPPGPGGLTSPCSSVHARRELERDWCGPVSLYMPATRYIEISHKKSSQRRKAFYLFLH